MQDESCNRECCPKKVAFISLLPFNVINHSKFAEKLATVELCTYCPMRMFYLPDYAVESDSRKQYELAWKSKNILSALFGEEEMELAPSDELPPLIVECTRRKKSKGGEW